MTGRDQRVFPTNEGLSTRHPYGLVENESVFSLEELTDNLDLVIESWEELMVSAHRQSDEAHFHDEK